jgi:hypothetical protein
MREISSNALVGRPSEEHHLAEEFAVAAGDGGCGVESSAVISLPNDLCANRTSQGLEVEDIQVYHDTTSAPTRYHAMISSGGSCRMSR